MHAEIVLQERGKDCVPRRVLPPGQYVIGRDACCDIALQTSDLAERHARLTFDGVELRIEDLGSSTGTFVEGQAVHGPVRLTDSQMVLLGSAVLKVKLLEKVEAAMETSLTPEIGEWPRNRSRSGRYRCIQEIGHGGMGTVFEAEDLELQRLVAIKVMRRTKKSSPEQMERFSHESRVTGLLEHPNIVPVHDCGVDEQGRPFYAMKLVQGPTLADVLDRIKRREAEALRGYSLAHLLTIFQKVCDAVAFAHSRGVIHRDLKPENIMVGGYGEVLVMDWGLAKTLAPSPAFAPSASVSAGTTEQGPKPEDRVDLPGLPALGNPRHAPPAKLLTVAGEILGTPCFMAPEQAAGNIEAVDARTDIFALGGILHNILTLEPSIFSRRPDQDSSATSDAGIAGPARRALPHCPGGRIPSSLWAVTRKALALRPEDRYQTVRELQRDTEAFQAGFATSAEQASALKLLTLLIKRHRIEAAALMVIAAMGAVFLLKLLASQRHARAVLQELHGTAPEYYQRAMTLVEEGRFEEALRRISFALSLAPEVAQYYELKGNVLQSLLRFTEAETAYAQALARDPTRRQASENKLLSGELSRELQASHSLSGPTLVRLITVMRGQGRFVEAQTMMRRLGQRLIGETAKGLLAQASLAGSLETFPDGMLRLDLYQTGVRDLAALRGLPIKELRLTATAVTDLNPLHGMPLRWLALDGTSVVDLTPLRGLPLQLLNLTGTPATDLGPLHGMPLVRLDVPFTRVTDLRPLEGVPLRTLNLYNTPVSDLSPLRGAPLESLVVARTQVGDLRPLAGMALQRLEINESPLTDLGPLRGMKTLRMLGINQTGVRDITPLQGLPLEEVILSDTLVTDVAPLAEFTSLELLTIPQQATNVAVLHRLPKLKRLSTHWPGNWNEVPAVEEFWKQHEPMR